MPGLGRDPALVSEVARRAPVTIIASTGWYGAAVLPPFFQLHGPDRLVSEPDPLIDLFMRDIETGIGASGVKAGMLKVTSSDDGITPDESRVMSAAADRRPTDRRVRHDPLAIPRRATDSSSSSSFAHTACHSIGW